MELEMEGEGEGDKKNHKPRGPRVEG